MPRELAQGGVVFRVDGELFFLPATIAMKVMPIPGMARVPGGPVDLRGVALVDGDMIPVVEVGSAPLHDGDRTSAAHLVRQGAMLVCKVLGECVGLVGIEVVATGHFERHHEHALDVKVGDETARPFDVAGVIARVREGRWAV